MPPLTKYLQGLPGFRVPMTFAEVEAVIGAKLPKSARLRNQWWSNNASNHVQANAWIEAGFRTEQVDMAKATMLFVRESQPHGMAEAQDTFGKHAANPSKPGQHPMIGVLKGTFTIKPGWDITKPTLDPGERAEWNASLEGKAASSRATRLSGGSPSWRTRPGWRWPS